MGLLFLYLFVCFRLRVACDCSFFYWHRVILPIYLTDLRENVTDTHRIHVQFSLFTVIVRNCSLFIYLTSFVMVGARSSSVVRVFADGAMGRRIDPSSGEPIELFFVPASAPRLV